MTIELTPSQTVLFGADFHVTQLPEGLRDAFFDPLRELCQTYPDAPLLHAGDLGWQGHGARPVITLNTEIAEFVNPRLIVDGNHDLHPSDVAATRQQLHTLEFFGHIDGKIIPLTDKTCIVGENGYPDYRSAGDSIRANANFRNTKELSFPEFYAPNSQSVQDVYGVARLMRAKADEATQRIVENLRAAFDTFDHVLLVTHYPPFLEAARHQGRVATPSEGSAIINKGLGDALLELMQQAPHRDKTVEVLCGHTHTQYNLSVLDNLSVRVAQGSTVTSDLKRDPAKVQVLRVR